MKQNYHFNKITNTDKLTILKNEWLTSLTSPQDGMWEFFRNSAMHWEIVCEDELIGYTSVNDENQLLQFYISAKYFSNGEVIFKEFIEIMQIKTGIVGTNNLGYLSIALNFVEKLKVHTYLFRNSFEVNIDEKEGILKECQTENLERIVDFCHYSMGAPKEWLTGYVGGLIEKKEIFFLEHDDKIIGTCEVRKSTTTPEFADIGMVVSPDFRRKGYGTYLLNKAKTIAIDSGKIPICSCEKDNVGSIKSINNCGFVSMYQLLSITFK
ncbi:MAG: GNAT family N-acetyltransferase [Saprospiraceae bacterium]